MSVFKRSDDLFERTSYGGNSNKFYDTNLDALNKQLEDKVNEINALQAKLDIVMEALRYLRNTDEVLDVDEIIDEAFKKMEGG